MKTTSTHSSHIPAHSFWSNADISDLFFFFRYLYLYTMLELLSVSQGTQEDRSLNGACPYLKYQLLQAGSLVHIDWEGPFITWLMLVPLSYLISSFPSMDGNLWGLSLFQRAPPTRNFAVSHQVPCASSFTARVSHCPLYLYAQHPFPCPHPSVPSTPSLSPFLCPAPLPCVFPFPSPCKFLWDLPNLKAWLSSELRM